MINETGENGQPLDPGALESSPGMGEKAHHRYP